MTGLGTTVKTIGLVAAAVIFLFWFIVGIAAASETSNAPFAAQSSAGTAGFFVSTIIGVIFAALVGGFVLSLGCLDLGPGTIAHGGRGLCCICVSVPNRRRTRNGNVIALHSTCHRRCCWRITTFDGVVSAQPLGQDTQYGGEVLWGLALINAIANLWSFGVMHNYAVKVIDDPLRCRRNEKGDRMDFQSMAYGKGVLLKPNTGIQVTALRAATDAKR